MSDNNVILKVKDLKTYFFQASGVSRAVDGVSFSLKQGAQGGLVMIAQIILGELRAFYDALPYLPVGGSFNEETADTVRIFQRISHIPQTGEIDTETWNRMAEEFDMVK